MTEIARRALVVCYSDLANDPRVLKQINWLTSAGWQVDSLGFGEHPSQVSVHFALSTRERLPISVALAMMMFPKRSRFRYLTQYRIPRELDLESYDAVVINEIDLLPWIDQVRSQAPAQKQKLHLDLHEFHVYDAPMGILKLLSPWLRSYHSWKRSLIGKVHFDSISTVAPGIAKLYESEFGLRDIQLILNSKPYLEVMPSQVDERRIELLYHGYAQMERGLAVLLEATALLDERFSVNMMLTGPDLEIEAVKRLAAQENVTVNWLDRVPMNEVSAFINRFDAEIIFYPPNSPNLLHSFPNKFFESLQARLAIVIGRSPSMQTVIQQYQNGFIVEGWTAKDLAQLLNGLDGAKIQQAKNHSAAAAKELSEENDQDKFLALLN